MKRYTHSKVHLEEQIFEIQKRFAATTDDIEDAKIRHSVSFHLIANNTLKFYQWMA